MNVNPKAPVLTRDEILINAPLSVVWKTQTDTWPALTVTSLSGPASIGRKGV